MSAEDYEGFRILREQRSEQGEHRRRVAVDDFAACQRRAEELGLTLFRHTAVHYSLRHPALGWIINFYPGNRRIWTNPNGPRIPFLRLPERWTLDDLVTAAADAMKTMETTP